MIIEFIKSACHFHNFARTWIFETHSTLLFTITDSSEPIVNTYGGFVKLLSNQKVIDIEAFKDNLLDFLLDIADLEVQKKISLLIRWIDNFLVEKM